MENVIQYARELYGDAPRVYALIVIWFVSYFCVLTGAAILKPVIGYWNAMRVMDVASYIWIGSAILVVLAIAVAVLLA